MQEAGEVLVKLVPVVDVGMVVVEVEEEEEEEQQEAVSFVLVLA